MHELIVDLSPTEGALVRALGLIERRGFDVRSATLDRGSLRVSLVARGESRSVDNLCRQLERLVDVRRVVSSKA